MGIIASVSGHDCYWRLNLGGCYGKDHENMGASLVKFPFVGRSCVDVGHGFGFGVAFASRE